ncbi:hypothetical protein SAMN05444342_3721 [Haladaptatus paucihalophilus DX253]|uniref:Uncharacterized protein n=1 Tax=Haladaptatus paucihalophilus DX253 TaxID=797209 RepID=A0A1M7A669_HALPU|nr:hypothetical protein SAMN05444342_3721 [Haladaptatus paucihalophilus DX253]
MAPHTFLRRAHRVIAILFLLSIPPAGYFSFSTTGGEVSSVVYLPLFPLLGLILTGGYLLIDPWIKRFQERRIT